MKRLLNLQAHALAILLVGIAIRIPALATPIIEGQRNSQTAVLTAGMIENGSFRMDAVAAWRGDLDARLVQELPIYNLATLAIAAIPGVPLDAAGRLASLAFWVLSFVALQTLWRGTLSPRARFWANLLFVLAPMNWYLSTAFMPESLLQLLAIAFMISALDYARRLSNADLVLLLLDGLLGLLVKFPSFVHLGLFACLVLVDRQGWKALFRPSLVLAGLLVVLGVLAWGENVKAVNSPYFADWSGWANVLGFMRPEASRLSSVYYLPLFGYNLAFISTLIGAPLVLVGLWHYACTFRKSFVSRVWIYLLLSLAISWLVWGKGAATQNYYNLPNLVLFCAAFGSGVRTVARVLQNRGCSVLFLRRTGAGVSCLVLISGLVGYLYLSRPDYITTSVADWVKANTQPTDLVIYQPRHSPAVMDYEHQPLLSHLSGRRTWIWTRSTPRWEKERALSTSAYAIITQPSSSEGMFEKLRRRFRGEPSPPPQSLQEEHPESYRQLFENGQFAVLDLRN